MKYPRTPHLPWSPGVGGDDIISTDLSGLEDADEVVATIKMDGENTTIRQDRVHARSLDSVDHISRHWIKALWSKVRWDIPEGWRVCGENLWATHSIKYDGLPSYFLGFSVWDDENVCLPWDDTVEWLELLGLEHVPEFYRGPFDPDTIHEAFLDGPGADLERCEGYVVRDTDAFHYDDFKRHVAKWVRKGHVQTEEHWLSGPVGQNVLTR